MMNQSQAMEVLEKALKQAEGDDVFVSLNGQSRDTTRLADSVITQNIASANVTLSMTSAFGSQHGSASTNDLSDESIAATAQRAAAIARVLPADPEYMPPVTPEEAGAYPQVGGNYPATLAVDPIAKAEALVEATKQVTAAGMRLSGAYANGGGFQALANSAGLRAFSESTIADAHMTVLGDGGSGWAEQTANDVGKMNVNSVVERALDIARAAQKPKPIEAGKYTTILSAEAMSSLAPFMIKDAKATDEGRTCLRGKVGQQVVGENVTIVSDPSDARCPGSPFHSGGFASNAQPWVENGVVKNLSYSRYWAKKQGKAANGGPSNLIMTGGDQSIGDMIASTERGILVTWFWYIRVVDPMTSVLTGMSRDGLFLIENGQIAHPVIQMRFNESVMGMLSRIEALSPAERTGPRALFPAAKVGEFNFSSVSKF